MTSCARDEFRKLGQRGTLVQRAGSRKEEEDCRIRHWKYPFSE